MSYSGYSKLKARSHTVSHYHGVKLAVYSEHIQSSGQPTHKVSDEYLEETHTERHQDSDSGPSDCEATVLITAPLDSLYVLLFYVVFCMIKVHGYIAS